MASRKTGIEIPPTEPIVSARSSQPPARVAERKPKRTPKKSQITAAPIASEKLAGIPSTIRSSTLSSSS